MEVTPLSLIIPDFYNGPKLQAAINQAQKNRAAVWVPADYAGTDVYTNPSNVPVFDMRGTGSIPFATTAANIPLPAATSGPGPVFNVKNYGAKGDAQSSQNCTPTSPNLVCTDVTFTAANVGQRLSCIVNGGGTLFGGVPTTFSTFVNSTTMTIPPGTTAGASTCMWGSPDDAAVSAALAAALLQMVNLQTSGNLSTPTASPVLYFPGCCYSLYNTGINISPASNKFGFVVRGDGIDVTKIYWHEGSTNGQGAALNCSNAGQVLLQGFTMDGAYQSTSFSNAALYMNCANSSLRDVAIQRFSGVGMWAIQYFKANNLSIVTNTGNGLQTSGGGEIYESLFSNNNGAKGNLYVASTFGMPTGTGLHVVNSLIDECATPPCVQVENSTDVYFNGLSAFTGVGVDGFSHVNIQGGSFGPFNTDGNSTALTIATHGMVTASHARFIGSGTGKSINNSGIFRDNGGNSSESLWLVTSGTSTGTTAVLTVQGFTANANTLCTAGDALEVQGVSPAGYNGYFPAGATSGITAMGTNTIQYTTAGSNLGAASGGYAFCRNMQNYSGNLPQALLNNPVPNTCYLTITPIVNATTYTLCNFGAQSATNITRIMASSQNVTTCATAPIITISDGTATQTLTLTTAKQSWDSAVDASTGVGTTIFKPNGTITVKYDVAAASACATPPTQLAISYNVSPILSN